jgi:isopropylmalate/homocitrate/citramalate synthase
LKLKKYIEHWAEHNNEHTVRFRESAEEASEMDLHETAEALRAAAEAGKAVSIQLKKAGDSIV